jgi:hypothetical protein
MTKDQRIAELEKRIKALEDVGKYWPGYTPPVDGPLWYTPQRSPSHWPTYGPAYTTWCGNGFAFSCLQ